jgi:hypothetical protein
MYWALSYVDDVPCIAISIRGMVSLDDIEALNATIISDSHWRKGLGLLFDSTKVEYPTEPPLDMSRVADTVAKMNGEFIQSKMAMVVATNLQFGLARQYQILVESRGGSPVGVFRDDAAAIDWLRSSNTEAAIIH